MESPKISKKIHIGTIYDNIGKNKSSNQESQSLIMGNRLTNFRQQLSPLYDEREAKSIYYLLMQKLLDCNLTSLLTRSDDSLSPQQEDEWILITNRLVNGEPLQYILGECEFHNLSFSVTSDVLIPRPETNELVEWITNDCSNASSILDIGTGSGCIAISLKYDLPHCSVSALDVSSKAIEIAKANAKRNMTDVKLFQHDILSNSIINEQYDVIVSNPPYIMMKEKSDMHKNVLDYEPHSALFVENEDPLLFYRTIAKFAQKHLSPNGFLFFEINEALGKETCDLLQSEGFTNILLRQDINGKDRMIKCQRN